jgi:hypothetical protein
MIGSLQRDPRETQRGVGLVRSGLSLPLTLGWLAMLGWSKTLGNEVGGGCLGWLATLES